MSSTTHSVELSRWGLAQMLHTPSSVGLWHVVQGLTPWRIATMLSAKSRTRSSSRANM